MSDVFLLDREQAVVRLVSVNRAGTAGGNGPSFDPLVTSDGRFVVFRSKVSDLVESDTNELTDIFVCDTAGSLFALSSTPSGSTGNQVSGNLVLGSDGRTVLLESFDSDLVSGDANDAKDIFILRLYPDPASEFRILTFTSLTTGETTVFWNSVPGRTYRLQSTDDLSAVIWRDAPGDVTAEGYTCSKQDPFPAPGGIRFYRVELWD